MLYWIRELGWNIVVPGLGWEWGGIFHSQGWVFAGWATRPILVWRSIWGNTAKMTLGAPLPSSMWPFFEFLPIFGSFFFTQKCVNRAQKGFCKNSVIRHKTDFKTTKQGNFFISSRLSCGGMWNPSIFGKNSHFSASIVWKKPKFHCMWRNLKFLHVCHVLSLSWVWGDIKPTA